MEPKTDLAKDAIVKAFTAFGPLSEKDTHELAFHLTDWIGDLQAFVNFLENPTMFTNDQIQQIVIRFLAHIPYHVKEASEMLYAAAEREGPANNEE